MYVISKIRSSKVFAKIAMRVLPNTAHTMGYFNSVTYDNYY